MLQKELLLAQNEDNGFRPERYIDRPLTIHNKNFEFAFGYQFGSLSSVYDQGGQSLSLADAGIAASNQTCDFQFTYGITERIQIQALISYYKYVKTTNEVIQAGIGYKTTESYGIKNSVGLLDPNIKLNYLILGNERKLSLSLGAGFTLPVAKYKPDIPEVDISGPENNPTYQFVYKYHNGLGTAAYNLNMALKYRFGNISADEFLSRFIARLYTNFNIAPEAILTNDWYSVFDVQNPDAFTFQPLYMNHQEGQWLENKLYVDYQAFNITSFFVGACYRNYFHGWNQINSLKILENDADETSLLIGAHIQASPKLRIDELIVKPVSGKNMESFFVCQIALIYNIKFNP
jgi:hypothetical protein